MSASWLITDGFSGETNGVNKIVTMGLYAGAAPPPPDTTYAPNWLSPSMRLGVFLLFCLLGDKCLSGT